MFLRHSVFHQSNTTIAAFVKKTSTTYRKMWVGKHEAMQSQHHRLFEKPRETDTATAWMLMDCSV